MSFYSWLKNNNKKTNDKKAEVREVREVRTESNFMKSKRLPPNPSLTYSNLISNNDSEKDPFKDFFEQTANEISQVWKKGLRPMSPIEKTNFDVWFKIFQDRADKHWIAKDFIKFQETMEQWKSLCLDKM